MQKHLLIINILLLLLALAASFIVGLFLISNFRANQAGAAANDKIPPIIFNSKIDGISTSSATIYWQTDEQSDSLVNYGLNRNYGMVRDPLSDKTSHKIILDDLLPDSTYYFRIISSDVSGNQAISSDFSFVTTGNKNAQVSEQPGQYPGPSETPGQYQGNTEQVSSSTETNKQQVTQILEEINKITDQRTLQIIQNQIQEQAQQVTEKLEIIFDKVDVETGVDYAIIKWQTNQEANSIVALVTEKDFNANNPNPYVWQEGNYDEQVIDHTAQINGLTPATTYHFQVVSKTSLGVETKSTDKVFVTKSILPEIYNITIAKIEESAATINFATNIPCSAYIEYTDLDTGETKMQGNSNYSIVHSIRLDNLKYDTYYSAMITAESENNDKAQSSPFTFLTIKDVLPPAISKVNTESTLYPGADTKVQTIISWETDEEAVCQFSFHQGFNATEKVDVLPMEKDYGTKHVQVTTNLLPSTVYKFWIECYDNVGNKARTSDYIMLTPTREQNIIDIILKNFESTFGWVNGKK
ncbi:MAG: fibronectin type III domain-containing protein [Patescibacteria group bacterium]|nr:fibronectin type III domain-containing protein [Patescibacteria group bacterium]